MITPLRFHPSVRDELKMGWRWYERQRTGLGREFLDETESVLAQIRQNPARFGFADDDIREGLLPRFPYAIYYRVRRYRIRILAILHTSRDESNWRSRV